MFARKLGSCSGSSACTTVRRMACQSVGRAVSRPASSTAGALRLPRAAVPNHTAVVHKPHTPLSLYSRWGGVSASQRSTALAGDAGRSVGTSMRGGAALMHRHSLRMAPETHPASPASSTSAPAATLHATVAKDGQDADEVASNRREEDRPTTPGNNQNGSQVARLLPVYASLSKARLGALVVATTAFGFAMHPAAALTLSQVGLLATTCVGTSLSVASAATFNQWWEVESDAQMPRTANRVLPTQQISRQHAFNFGLATGLAGPAMLALGVNPLTAALAASNVLLYSLVYTPMKKHTTLNTYVGAIVGAIPPMMGWAAHTGTLDSGAWLLGALLFTWQLPHFFALSYTIRGQYGKAGYKMLASLHPEKTPTRILQTSLAMLPFGPLAVYLDLCEPLFATTATAATGYLCYLSYRFYNEHTNSNARKVFLATLPYLPLLLALMLVSKKKRTTGEGDDQDDLLLPTATA